MAKKTIKAAEFVKDLQNGLTDIELMKKHDLSADDLRCVYDKLIERNAIDRDALDARNGHVGRTDDRKDLRSLPRNYPALSVTVQDGTSSRQRGVVRDITVEGIGVIGIDAVVGDKRTFVVDMGKLTDFDSFTFEAECRWYDRPTLDGQCIAGFYITKISKQSRRKLKELIEGFTLRTDTVRLALS